ncbi:TraB/VirB10 family protein [Shewanella morhuae]|uniref:Conjugal transfer pilus assembly protein TraB n=1 Tax=Shewanella morhuae TaxID=365591 RepID=A0A380C0S9_9GAMM|nr:TraB/VirB10 family protein [Shewanella morhuae]SUJ10210.1 conjugal transfer pilus assembly protein TraB [Shewanella morhuae]
MSKIIIKEFWQDPKKRQIIIWAVVLIALYFLIPLFFTPTKKTIVNNDNNNGTELFSVAEVSQMEEKKTKEMFDQLAADSQNREVAAFAQENRLKEREKKIELELFKFRNEINEQRTLIGQLKNELASNKNAQGTGQQNTGDGTIIRHDQNGNVAQIVERPQTQIITRQPLIKGSMLRTVTQGKVRSVKETGHIEEQDVKLVTVTENTQTVSNDKTKAAAANTSAKAKVEDNSSWLSAGSILTGTLLNGVDAPTSGGQQSKMPMPILIRVKHDALMPNNYTLDIRECFVIGTAVGDLATSRAFIRAETLSCITEDSKAIEVPLTAYAVGRDGKNGIDGTLVTKSGGLMGNAMAAGFLSGLSKAASPQSVNVLNTNPGSESLFQSTDWTSMGQSAALNGASTSFDMIAKYYLELVDASWPVVEVLGGREVDFIVQRGIALKIGK